MEVLIRGDDLFVPFNSVQKLCRKKKVTTILTQLSQEIKTLHSFVYLKGQSN